MYIRILSRPNVEPETMCVYRIRYGNFHFYIGAAKCLNKRIDGHIVTFKQGKVNGRTLPNISPRAAIKVDILELVYDISLLAEREQYYLNLNKNKKGCLNNTKSSRTKYRIRKGLRS